MHVACKCLTLTHEFCRFAARLTRHAAEAASNLITIAEEPARKHIGTISDACRVMANRRSRHAKGLQVFERAKASVIQADACVVQNHPSQTSQGCQISAVTASVRTGDEHSPRKFRAKLGNAVSYLNNLHPPRW